MNEFWVWCGVCDESSHQDISRLLAKAQQLAQGAHDVCAIVTSTNTPGILPCLSGANRILWLPTTGSPVYLGNLLAALSVQRKPEIILASANVTNSHILSRAAAQLEAGLSADCTDLWMDDEKLVMHRPAFGGGIEADIVCPHTLPQMATVRPGAFSQLSPINCDPLLDTLPIMEIPDDPIRLLESIPAVQNFLLTEAEIVVAGGLGIGSKENFALLQKLADKIGGVVGASRAAVDAGFASWSCQIGQTGITVHPKLYIAFGISGSVQHIMGMHGAECVIAVNTDPKAPIFEYADIAIVEDWKIIAEKLLNIP